MQKNINTKKTLHGKNHVILKTEGRAQYTELTIEVWGKLKVESEIKPHGFLIYLLNTVYMITS